MAAMTAIPNTPAIVLQPTGPGGPTTLNPVYFACDPTNGNYFTASGRDLVTFYLYPVAAAAAWAPTVTYGVGDVVSFSLSASITATQVTSNVLTVTAVNTFQPGDPVLLSGLTTSTFLNAQTVTVISSSGGTFTAAFTHSDYALTSDTGTAAIVSAAWIALQSNTTNLNIHPTSTAGAALWASYTGGGEVTLFSAPDICTGRTSDVDNYNVPLGAGSVEFLVLPSSVFTQANGQFQFKATNNLVFVYVRSL